MEQSLKHLRFPLAALAIVVMSACGKTPQATAPAPAAKVSVAKVLEQPVNEWDEFTGRLEAPESVESRPRVSGQIDQVAFTEGALVKKGDMLFQIDPRPFQAEVRRLEAQVQQARANATRSIWPDTRGRISTVSGASSRPVNSSHSLTGCSSTLATLTFAAGAGAVVSGVLPHALITTMAKAASGKRKCFSDCSMGGVRQSIEMGG